MDGYSQINLVARSQELPSVKHILFHDKAISLENVRKSFCLNLGGYNFVYVFYIIANKTHELKLRLKVQRVKYYTRNRCVCLSTCILFIEPLIKLVTHNFYLAVSKGYMYQILSSRSPSSLKRAILLLV